MPWRQHKRRALEASDASEAEIEDVEEEQVAGEQAIEERLPRFVVEGDYFAEICCGGEVKCYSYAKKGHMS
jgi:hypothetical protein